MLAGNSDAPRSLAECNGEIVNMRTPVGHNNRKALLFVGAWMLLAGPAAMAQTDPAAQPAAVKNPNAAEPAFEVATIRPANRDDGRRWFGTKLDASGRLTASAAPLEMLVQLAYLNDPHEGTVTTDRGLPKWISSEQYDITAKVDEDNLSGWDKLSYKERMVIIQPMLRRLLSERFHLKLRVETRNTPVYALVLAKGGPHVKEVPTPPDMDNDEMAKWSKDNPGKPIPGMIMCSGDRCTVTALKISDATWQIRGTSEADRMVIDATGLKGYYDFSFRFTTSPDDTPMHQMEEDLGMKFVPRTVPMKSYVIEAAEKPSLDGA